MARTNLVIRQSGASHFPCPGGNNTQIGDVQSFNVLCGVDIGGIEIDRMQLDSLNTCTGLCTTHQAPRCDGVTFRADNTCIFKTLSAGPNVQPATGADSAIGILPNPPPSSRCSSLGTGTLELVQDKNFDLQCGQIFQGNDIEQQFHATFDDCLAACAAVGACGGVSFDAAQSQGFKNCYLKTQVNTGGLLTKLGTDSAIVMANNNNVNNAGPPSGTVTSQAAVAALPSSSSFMLAIVPTAATTMTASVVAPLAESTFAPTAEPTPATAASTTTTSTGAWIAAPVIGSLAAMTLILAVFILWGRRRRGQGLPFGFVGERPRGRHADARRVGGGGRVEKLEDDDDGQIGPRALSRSATSFSRPATSSSRGMAPLTRSSSSSGRGGGGRPVTRQGPEFRVVTGSGRRLGHDHPIDPGLDFGLEDMVGERDVLRDSQNGLKLNGVSVKKGSRMSVPGIPDEFAGPAESPNR